MHRTKCGENSFDSRNLYGKTETNSTTLITSIDKIHERKVVKLVSSIIIVIGDSITTTISRFTQGYIMVFSERTITQ